MLSEHSFLVLVPVFVLVIGDYNVAACCDVAITGLVPVTLALLRGCGYVVLKMCKFQRFASLA